MPDATAPTPRDPTVPDLGNSGWISGLIDLIRGINGNDISQAGAAAGAADPFNGERGQYQRTLATDMAKPSNYWMSKLQDLMTNPGSFQTDPGYQFAKEQGLEGVARHGNAMFGTTRAGNTAIELDKFGTGFAEQAYDTRVQQLLANAGLESQNYNTRINQLLAASGATTGSPAEAGRIMAGGYANRDASLAGGARGIDQLLSLLTGKGGQSILSAGSNALSTIFKTIFGSDGGDMSNLFPTSDAADEFLRSIGLDPTVQLDGISNIFDLSGTAGLENFNIGDLTGVSDSTANLLGDPFGG
jgi:hypothetical protein